MPTAKQNAPRADNDDSPQALRAEVERLKAALAQAEWKIADLEARADIDPLLGILNRRGFARELARSIAYVKRYSTEAALVIVDLDGFKDVNDSHGHAAGDALLIAIASALRAHVRASDVVARLGGDEFAVLMWNLNDAAAAAKAGELESIIASVQVAHRGETLFVGASAGSAPLNGDVDAMQIIEDADHAMYARKKAKR